VFNTYPFNFVLHGEIMNQCPLTLKELLPYASPTEALYIRALDTAGSERKAAKAIGRSRSTIRSAVLRARQKAARQGHAPEKDLNHPAPDGMMAETSTLFRRNKESGEDQVVLQWVKSKQDREKFQTFMIESAKAMSEDIPKTPAVKRQTKVVEADLCNLYVITDYHLGMKADAKETRTANGDWDMHIAEELLVRWFQEAIKLSPDAEKAVFGQIGDFLHWDGLDAVTPMSGHTLDADDRFDKLVNVTIRVIRRIVQMLLEKHETVHLIMAEGNHDMASSVWLRQMMSALYDNEPRITVDLSADPYYCYEFGENTLFFHHGHKKRVNNVDDVLVSKFRKEYGRTKFSHAHMGHLHHERVLETNLMTVEQHQTLAAKDSYASRGGWMANRCARAITYHAEFGKVMEHSISPEMLKAYT
jgi:hypothetical protein